MIMEKTKQMDEEKEKAKITGFGINCVTICEYSSGSVHIGHQPDCIGTLLSSL